MADYVETPELDTDLENLLVAIDGVDLGGAIRRLVSAASRMGYTVTVEQDEEGCIAFMASGWFGFDLYPDGGLVPVGG